MKVCPIAHRESSGRFLKTGASAGVASSSGFAPVRTAASGRELSVETVQVLCNPQLISCRTAEIGPGAVLIRSPKCLAM